MAGRYGKSHVGPSGFGFKIMQKKELIMILFFYLKRKITGNVLVFLGLYCTPLKSSPHGPEYLI
jgi:hypothetical protein